MTQHGYRRALLVVTLATTTLCAATPIGAAELVMAKPGNLPIVLTAPHGGTRSVPGVPARTSGTTATDTGTLELANAVARRLETMLGQPPYLVTAEFSRRYIDANRDEADAFEAPAAKPIYLDYHDMVRAYVDDVRRKFPQGALLIDIHGQSSDPEVLHRGTRDGRTVVALVKRHGEDAVSGPNSILGQLVAQGVAVFPRGRRLGDPREDPRYNGGYTVASYGSHRPNGIDAIQLEFGRAQRADPALADKLAVAIAAFYRRYLAAVVQR